MLNKIKEGVSSYPERIILGIAVIILIMVVLATVNQGKDVDSLRMEGKIKAAKSALDSGSLTGLGEIKQREMIEKSWTNLDFPPELKDETMFRRTVYIVEWTTPPQPKLKGIKEPTNVALAVNPKQPDRVVISWSKDPTPPGKEIAEQKAFRISRRMKGEIKATLLTEVKPGAITETSFTYTDTQNLQPETEYQYEITALAEEKSEDMNEGKTESKAITASVVMPEDVNIKALLGNVADKWAELKIEKYIGGTWTNTSIYLKKDEAVGKDKFKTNYILKEIEQEIRDKPVGTSKIKQVVYKITLKNSKTGKEKMLETEPRTLGSDK